MYLSKDLSEIIKNYAQVGAWGAAALYFVVKFAHGYLTTDMSVVATTVRQASDTEGMDYLAITARLSKGGRGSFHLHDAKVLVVQGEKAYAPLKLGIDRFDGVRDGRVWTVGFESFSPEIPMLNITAGESAEWSTWLMVGSSHPCQVEVVILGTGFFKTALCQWRASAVSLPVAQTGQDMEKTAED